LGRVVDSPRTGPSMPPAGAAPQPRRDDGLAARARPPAGDNSTQRSNRRNKERTTHPRRAPPPRRTVESPAAPRPADVARSAFRPRSAQRAASWGCPAGVEPCSTGPRPWNGIAHLDSNPLRAGHGTLQEVQKVAGCLDGAAAAISALDNPRVFRPRTNCATCWRLAWPGYWPTAERGGSTFPPTAPGATRPPSGHPSGVRPPGHPAARGAERLPWSLDEPSLSRPAQRHIEADPCTALDDLEPCKERGGERARTLHAVVVGVAGAGRAPRARDFQGHRVIVDEVLKKKKIFFFRRAAPGTTPRRGRSASRCELVPPRWWPTPARPVPPATTGQREPGSAWPRR